jgi:hypothetical protein
VIPVTIPVEEPTLTVPEPAVALHEPPVVTSASVVFNPSHTVAVPVIADGSGVTVTTTVVRHPVGKVYVMVTGPEVVPPVTIPDEVPTVAIERLPLLQIPPAVALLSVVVSPGHTVRVPVIAAGSGFTVTVVTV